MNPKKKKMDGNKSSSPTLRGAHVTLAVVVRTALEDADSLVRRIEADPRLHKIYVRTSPGRLRIVEDPESGKGGE